MKLIGKTHGPGNCSPSAGPDAEATVAGVVPNVAEVADASAVPLIEQAWVPFVVEVAIAAAVVEAGAIAEAVPWESCCLAKSLSVPLVASDKVVRHAWVGVVGMPLVVVATAAVVGSEEAVVVRSGQVAESPLS